MSSGPEVDARQMFRSIVETARHLNLTCYPRSRTAPRLRQYWLHADLRPFLPLETMLLGPGPESH